jgi:hydrogenase nickel incorporation protein HypA/HybF
MHELSLCQALIATAERQLAARPECASRTLKTLKVTIGALSGCEPELLERMFPHAARGTAAENASLQITFQPVEIECKGCGGKREVAANDLLCPECNSDQVAMVAGDELLLTALVLADN